MATYHLHRMGPYDPTTRLESNRYVRSFRLPEGAATLELRVTGPLEVQACGWGPGTPALFERLPELVGLEDDLAGFVIPPPLERAARQLKGLRIVRLPEVLRGLVQIIVEQRITWREAARSFRQLVLHYGEPAPGPHQLTLFPEPGVLRGLSFAQWAELGVERKRAETIRRVAVSHRRVEELRRMDFASAERRLRAFPGVGAWTAQGTLGFILGHADAVLVQDFDLPRLVAFVFTGNDRADDARMLEILEPYRGHRWRVIRMIQESGMHAPRRGPRRRLGPRPGPPAR